MNTRRLHLPDLETGVNFINQLPLADPQVAEQELMRFLDALRDAPLNTSDRLSLLEQTRVPLCFVEEEIALSYHNKPLPFSAVEEQHFQQVLTAWRQMARAYSICLETGEAAADATVIATILHRCLFYTGSAILEHYRARRELPPGIWIELHRYFAQAEARGVALIPVSDVLDHDQQATHCTAAYITTLLIDLASPYSQSLRDLDLIRRWANMWAPLATISPVADDNELPGFVIELQKDFGIHPTPYNDELAADGRHLETERLRWQIHQVLKQLRQHMPPSQLNLGEESNTHVTRLLSQLSRPWTQSTAPRRFRRFATTGQTQVAVGFETMHFFVTGTRFSQQLAQAYAREPFNPTFLHVEEAAYKPAVHTPDFPCDTWEVFNQSASGFRLGRGAPGAKMTHSQLLALCPHDGENFILAQVSWLMQEQSGGLVAGVAILPGMPSGIGVRLADMARGGDNRFVRAFMLPPVPSMSDDGSLILPTGVFQAGQLLDIGGDTLWLVKMKNVLQRGTDFERISFERV